MATIMESYDIQLMSSFFAFPQFQERYGERLPNGKYSIPAAWQLGLSLVGLLGLIIGVFANGSLANRFGPRRVMMISFVVLTGLISISFTAKNVESLLVGSLLWYGWMRLLEP